MNNWMRKTLAAIALLAAAGLTMPCAVRIGRRVKFTISDVNAWIARHRESSPGRRPGGR